MLPVAATMAKAVVASPQAMTGLAVEPGRQLLCAGAPAEWIDAIDLLLDDVDVRRRLGRAGRRYVEEHHVWEHCLQPLAQWIQADRAADN